MEYCFWVAFALTGIAFILAWLIKDEYKWDISKKEDGDVHAGHPIAI